MSLRQKLFALIILFLGISVRAAELVLTENGKTPYVIIIPEKPLRHEGFIAADLAEHLQKMSGVKFPVLRENWVKGKPKIISVGNTALARQQGIDQNRLSDEDIIIRTTPDGNLILTGGKYRGVVFAVYDFLEKQLGCHWFDEFNSEIPQKERISVKELHLQYHPYFAYRNISHGFPVETRSAQIFRLRCQASTYIYLVDYAMYGSPASRHTFHFYCKAFPANRQDLFSMDEKGRRQKPSNEKGPEFCLSNPDAVKIITKELKKYIAEDRQRCVRRGMPYPRIYDISQNDHYKYFCLCPKCKKITAKYGNEPSGLLLCFINQVADNIKDEYPDILIQTFAYRYAQECPRGIKPRDNVIIRYCTTADEYAIPLDAPGNQKTRQELTSWSKISKNIGIWTYWYYCRDTFPMPYVFANQFGSDFKLLASNNVKTVYAEYYDFYKLSFFALQRWLGYQLMQNPMQDADHLIQVFMNGYYGASAPAIREYYLYLLEKEKGMSGGLNTKTPRPYLNAEFFKKADEILNRAEAACKPGSQQLLNVRRERAIVDAAYLNLRKKLKSFPLDERTVLKRYEAYRNEMLNTIVSKERYSDWKRKINNEINQLKHQKEVAEAKKKWPAPILVPRVSGNDWSKAGVISKWSENFGIPSDKPLIARFLHDGKSLKIRLEETGIKRPLKSSPVIWKGDDWELHFAADKAKGPLRMIAVNPENKIHALEIVRTPRGMPTATHYQLSKFAQTISKVTPGSWTVEITIPLAELIKGGAKPGQTIFMNVFRSAQQIDEAQAWSPTFDKSFHIPWRLNKVYLGK